MIFKVKTKMCKDTLEMLEEKFSKAIKEPGLIVPEPIDVVPISNITVITKHEFITEFIDICMKKEEIDKRWNEISKGYNFILRNKEGRYLSIDYLNKMLSDNNG